VFAFARGILILLAFLYAGLMGLATAILAPPIVALLMRMLG